MHTVVLHDTTPLSLLQGSLHQAIYAIDQGLLTLIAWAVALFCVWVLLAFATSRILAGRAGEDRRAYRVCMRQLSLVGIGGAILGGLFGHLMPPLPPTPSLLLPLAGALSWQLLLSLGAGVALYGACEEQRVGNHTTKRGC